MAKSSTIATLNVAFKAKTKSFMRSLKNIRKRFESFKKSIFSMKTAIIGATSAIAVGYLKSIANNIDQTAKFADTIGIASENLQKLQAVSELAGMTNEAVNMSLRAMIDTIGEAKKGTASYSQVFKKLNLNVDDLSRMTPDQQFLKIADAMKAIDNDTERLNAGIDIFTKRGAGMLKVIEMGSDKIKDQAEKISKLGFVVSRFDASMIEEANDSLTKLGWMIQGIFRTSLVQLAPWIKKINDYLLDFAVNLNIRNSIKQFADILVKNLGKAIDWLRQKFTSFFVFISESLAMALAKYADAIGNMSVGARSFMGFSDKTSEDLVKAGNSLANFASKMKTASLMSENSFSVHISERLNMINTKTQEASNSVAKFGESAKKTNVYMSAFVNALSSLSTKGLGEKIDGGMNTFYEKTKSIVQLFADMKQEAKDIGQSIKSAIATPMQNFKREATDAMKALALGEINKEEFKKYGKSLIEKYSPTETRKIGSFQQIDQSLLSVKGLANMGKTIEVKQLKEQKNMNKYLEGILENTSKQNIAIAG